MNKNDITNQLNQLLTMLKSSKGVPNEEVCGFLDLLFQQNADEIGEKGKTIPYLTGSACLPIKFYCEDSSLQVIYGFGSMEDLMKDVSKLFAVYDVPIPTILGLLEQENPFSEEARALKIVFFDRVRSALSVITDSFCDDLDSDYSENDNGLSLAVFGEALL